MYQLVILWHPFVGDVAVLLGLKLLLNGKINFGYINDTMIVIIPNLI